MGWIDSTSGKPLATSPLVRSGLPSVPATDELDLFRGVTLEIHPPSVTVSLDQPSAPIELNRPGQFNDNDQRYIFGDYRTRWGEDLALSASDLPALEAGSLMGELGNLRALGQFAAPPTFETAAIDRAGDAAKALVDPILEAPRALFDRAVDVGTQAVSESARLVSEVGAAVARSPLNPATWRWPS